MNSNLLGSEKLFWETLFDQATEDISTYHWAVEVWSDPPEGYTPGYLVILLLSHRARTQLALEKMKGTLPDKYMPYRSRINSLWLKSEKKLKEEVLPVSDQIKSAIGKEFDEWLEKLETSLNIVSHLAQEGDLLNDPDWVAEDIREEGHEFLLRFQDIALTREALKQFSFLTVEAQNSFERKFVDLEQSFRRSFGYFSPLKDIFLSLNQREYKLDRWWLSILPEEEDIQEEEIPEEVMAKLKEAYQAQDIFPTSNCLDPELVIAYASNELDPEENKKVESHVIKCRHCLELVLDVRLVESEARERNNEILEMPPELWRAIREKDRHDKEKNINEEKKVIISLREQQQLWIMPPARRKLDEIFGNLPIHLGPIIDAQRLSLPQPRYVYADADYLDGREEVRPPTFEGAPELLENEGFEIYPVDGELNLLDLENPPDVLKDLLTKGKRADIYWSIIGWQADGKKIEFQILPLPDEPTLIIENLNWEVILFAISENKESLRRFIELCQKMEFIEEAMGVKWIWFRIKRTK